MKTLITFLLISTFQISKAQQKNPLKIFEPLIGHSWHANGKWSDGSEFKQETVMRYGLNENLIIVNTKGHTNIKKNAYGNKNYGVRQFDKKAQVVRF